MLCVDDQDWNLIQSLLNYVQSTLEIHQTALFCQKKWNEQEPRGQQCANWRMMDQDKHHQCIISLAFFQGISMLSYSSIWKWARVTVLFRSFLSSMIWSGHTYANIFEYGHTYVKLWMTKGEDLSCAIPWHSANCKRNIKKNQNHKFDMNQAAPINKCILKNQWACCSNHKSLAHFDPE